MLLVIALPDMAQRLSRLLLSAHYIVDVTSESDLRHRVHEFQPEIVVLDWRIGGNRWRAIDEVPALVSRTSTHPYVVLLAPRTSSAVEKEAASRECYDVVSASDVDFDYEICEAVETATKARASRRLSPRRVSRGDLH